jgi:hypothetical protein
MAELWQCESTSCARPLDDRMRSLRSLLTLSNNSKASAPKQTGICYRLSTSRLFFVWFFHSCAVAFDEFDILPFLRNYHVGPPGGSVVIVVFVVAGETAVGAAATYSRHWHRCEPEDDQIGQYSDSSRTNPTKEALSECWNRFPDSSIQHPGGYEYGHRCGNRYR